MGDTQPTPNPIELENDQKNSISVDCELTINNQTPRTFILYRLIVNDLLTNNQLIKEHKIPDLIVNTLSTIKTSKNGANVLIHLWKNGVTTSLELESLYGIRRHTGFRILKKLELIGVLDTSRKVEQYGSGEPPTLYGLTIADDSAYKAAQIRYHKLKGTQDLIRQKIKDYSEENKEYAKEYDLHLQREQEEAKRQSIIDLIKTSRKSLYYELGKPVDLNGIYKDLRNNGIDNIDLVHKLSEELETEGILTSSYLAGEPDPNHQPSKRVLRIRAQRGDHQ